MVHGNSILELTSSYSSYTHVRKLFWGNQWITLNFLCNAACNALFTLNADFLRGKLADLYLMN